LKQWGILPFDLDSAAEAVCEQFVRGLLHQRLIPEDEFNDGLILAETSLEEIPLLVTSDRHLLDIDDDALLLRLTRPTFRRFIRFIRNVCCALCVRSPRQIRQRSFFTGPLVSGRVGNGENCPPQRFAQFRQARMIFCKSGQAGKLVRLSVRQNLCPQAIRRFWQVRNLQRAPSPHSLTRCDNM